MYLSRRLSASRIPVEMAWLSATFDSEKSGSKVDYQFCYIPQFPCSELGLVQNLTQPLHLIQQNIPLLDDLLILRIL
jgi:hypothetical protein